MLYDISLKNHVIMDIIGKNIQIDKESFRKMTYFTKAFFIYNHSKITPFVKIFVISKMIL